MNANKIAGAAGRTLGTTARYVRQLNDHIDWAEVAQIVVHGLKVLVVFAWLAGRAARRLWDALVPLSEAMGHRYARLIGAYPEVGIPLPQPPAASPLEAIAAAAQQTLEPLPVVQLRRLARSAGLPRTLSRTGRKAELLDALVGLEVALI